MLFNRRKLKLKPLSKRVSDLDISTIMKIDKDFKYNDKRWNFIAKKIIDAKNNGSSIILMIGGHVIRSGTQNYIIDLMKRGYISCIATNGSGMIHDFEFSLIGKTTESVARYIKEGQFGLWKETGELNDIINKAYKENKLIGMGEAVGKAIYNGNYPYQNISLLAWAYRLKIPFTVHVGIGYDIIHEHPNCDGSATGALSYNDFLKFAKIVENLKNGVVMNFGSAVMAPEVFLKALSMARNVAHQNRKNIDNFTTVVCDLYNLPKNIKLVPNKENVSYYFRPWKTMLVRTLDKGKSFYIKGRHEETIPSLWSAINLNER